MRLFHWVARSSVLGSVLARHLAAACICGGMLALVETAEVFAGGHGATLSFGQGVLFFVVSAGLLTFAAGLVGAGAMFVAHLLRQIGPLRTLRFSDIGATAAVTGCNVLLALVALVPLYGPRHVTMSSWELLATLPVAACVGMVANGTVRRWPGLLALLVTVNIALGYLVLSRWLYMFSRYGSLRYLHGLGLVLLLLLLHWIVFHRPWRGGRGEKVVGKLALAALGCGYAIALLVTSRILDHGGHALPVVLHERTTLVHRVLSWTPPLHSARLQRLDAWATACEPDVQRELPSRPRADVVVDTGPVRGVLLLVVDSLRADRLEATRDGRPLTPSLRREAKRSTLFANAFAAYPGTLLSLQAMTSGRYLQSSQKFREEPTGLGELLRAHGVTAEAIIGHENLRITLHDMKLDERLDVENLPEGKKARTSPDVARASLEALARLSAQDKRFLLVSHFYDPHAHYVGNELADFGSSEEDRYDAEVYYTDHWMGWLLREAESAALLDGVAIAIINDHGDEFWDHRYMRHQFRLYDETIRHLLMIRMPGQELGRRVTMPVSGVDLRPTLLALLGISDDAEVDGVSLLPWMVSNAEEDEGRPVFMRAAAGSKVGVVSAGRKLIVNQDLGALELYDLGSDPRERVNLADAAPPNAKRLYCLVREWAADEGLWSSGG